MNCKNVSKEQAKQLVLFCVENNQWITGGEIWLILKSSAKDVEDRKFLRSEFPLEDQTVRNLLAELLESKKVKVRQRARFALNEWAIRK